MEQQEVNPTVYGNIVANAQKEQVISAIKDLVNPDAIIKDMAFQLTGRRQVRVYNDKKREYELKTVIYHEPLLNDLGVSKILSDFRAYINPNVVLTYLKEKDIIARSRAYYTNISFELARNMLKYGVNNKDNHAKIRTIMGTNFHTALWRSYNGMTLLTSLKNFQVSEIRDLNEQKQKLLGGVFHK